MKCKVEKCDNNSRNSRAVYCYMHYKRFLKDGTVGQSAPKRNNVIDGLKTCKKCLVQKSIDNFQIKSDLRRYHVCNSCKPLYIKETNIKHKFGLSVEEYDVLISNGCAICSSKYRLAVDHDHSCCQGKKSCGKCIRGVLCMRHNLALGNLRDSLDELEKIKEYLTK